MAARLVDTLERFATVSGLRVEPQKCHGFCLNTTVTDKTIGPYPALSAREATTYLWVKVGTGEQSGSNWDGRVKAIKKRVGVMSTHTAGLGDRITLWNAVVIPSLVFTGTYVQPRPEDFKAIDAMLRNYLWRGLVSAEQARHKTASDMIHLDRDSGGMGVADYRARLMSAAAKTILNWTWRTGDKVWAVTNSLLTEGGNDTARPSPRAWPTREATTFAPSRSILDTGLATTNALITARYPPSAALVQAKAAFLAGADGRTPGFRWLTSRRGELTFAPDRMTDMAALQRRVYVETPPKIRAFWGSFRPIHNPWVTTATGTVLGRAQATWLADRI